MTNTLQDLREQIDAIDRQWIEALAKRFAITQKVGELKRDKNIESVDPEREARQMEHIAELAKEYGISPTLARDILRLIIDEVVKNHTAIRDNKHVK